MKRRTTLAALAATAFGAAVIGAGHVFADGQGIYVGSYTDVYTNSNNQVCASQATQVQNNGSDVVNRNDGQCVP